MIQLKSLHQKVTSEADVANMRLEIERKSREVVSANARNKKCISFSSVWQTINLSSYQNNWTYFEYMG